MIAEDSPDWRELDTYSTKKFIEDVRDLKFADLFTGKSYELWARNMLFFDGFQQYSLQNKATFPYFCLNYVSNGEEHYYLDGSEHPIELMIKQGALRLTLENVMEYIAFHSDVAFDPYRKVTFITHPNKSPYSGASAMRHHFNVLAFHCDLSVQESEEDLCFYIIMPVLYNGETVQGHVQVMKTGEINILSPVHIPLMEGTRTHAPLDLDHPHEKELLQQNFDILEQSKEGKRLLDTVKFYGGEIKFISGIGFDCFAPDTQRGYVIAPENVNTYSPYQVLSIASVLRDIELQYLEQDRGDILEDKTAFHDANMARNLDILLKLCTIVDELNEAGYDNILRRFKKAGFGQIYSDYRNGKPMENMVQHLANRYKLNVKEDE